MLILLKFSRVIATKFSIFDFKNLLSKYLLVKRSFAGTVRA